MAFDQIFEYEDAQKEAQNKKEQEKRMFKKYGGILKEIEDQLYLASSVESDDDREPYYKQAGELAYEISIKSYRDDQIKKLCKKILGSPKEYSRIKPYMDDPNEIRSPVKYDYENYRILFDYGNNTNIIAEDFLIYVKYILLDEQDNTRWIIEVKDRKGSETLEISNKEFASAKDLKSLFLGKKRSLIITDNQLSHLHNFLLKQGPKDGKKIVRLGYDPNSDAFIYSNGAFYDGKIHAPKENGIIELGKNIISMPIFDREKAKDHWFRYIEPPKDRVSLSDFFEYLATAYNMDVAVNVMSHYLFSIFRDIVVEYSRVSPILFLKGAPGSGKTSVARLITALFGPSPVEGIINLKADPTPIGLGRVLSQYSNIPLWVEEFNPSSKYAESIMGKVQASYDNMSAIKAKQKNGDFNTGLETEGPPIKASVFMTSNFLPEAEHFFSRTIYVSLSNQKKTPEQDRAYYTYLRPIEDNGISYITSELQKYRSEVRKNFKSEYLRIFQDLKKMNRIEGTQDRQIINISVTYAVLMIIQKHTAVINYKGTNEELREALYSHALNQIRGQVNAMNNTNVLKVFFEILQKKYSEGKLLKDKEFRFDESKSETLLLLRFGLLYSSKFKFEYQMMYKQTAPDKAAIENEIINFLGLTSVTDLYTSRRFEVLNSGKPYNDFGKGMSKKTTPYGDVIVFPYEALKERFFIDFDRELSENNF